MAENVFRVTTIALAYGQQCQNVFHFSGPSSDPAQRSALADEVQANWLSHIKPLISADVVWQAIQVRLLDSQFSTFTKTISVAGTASASNQNFPQVCWKIWLRAATIGRHTRGRVYLPGVASGTLVAGFWRSDLVNSWELRLATVMESFGPGGSSVFRLGIAPKTNSTANWLEVVQLQLAPTSGTQRRRNIGVGI